MEKRKQTRFELSLPVTILLECESGDNTVVNAITRDVSSDGAFLVLAQPLPEGCNLKLEMSLKIERLAEIIGSGQSVRVVAAGRVVRSDLDGVGVDFRKGHRIVMEGVA